VAERSPQRSERRQPDDKRRRTGPATAFLLASRLERLDAGLGAAKERAPFGP
jgi:hypothetical protein